MFAHMKLQVKNPVLVNSRFVFDQVLFLDIKFHKLNLTRGGSYLPLPDWISGKKAVINPKNEEDKECFKWIIFMALHHENIDSHLEQILKIKRLNQISVFKQNNNISVNVLAIGGGKEKLYILRRAKFNSRRRTTNLLLIVKDEKRHYTAIKNLS